MNAESGATEASRTVGGNAPSPSNPPRVPAPVKIEPPSQEDENDEDDVNYLLTPEFVKMTRYLNDGNSREQNRARAIALGFKQKGVKVTSVASLPMASTTPSMNQLIITDIM